MTTEQFDHLCNGIFLILMFVGAGIIFLGWILAKILDELQAMKIGKK